MLVVIEEGVLVVIEEGACVSINRGACVSINRGGCVSVDRVMLEGVWVKAKAHAVRHLEQHRSHCQNVQISVRIRCKGLYHLEGGGGCDEVVLSYVLIGCVDRVCEGLYHLEGGGGL